MNPELQDYARQFEAVTQEARDLAAGLSPAQWSWRPEPGRWSIAECLDHLNVSVRTTLPAFDRAIEDAEARSLRSPGPFRYGLIANWVVHSMEPPVKRRFRTFRELIPAADKSRDQVLSEFMSLRDQLAQRLRRSDGLDLKRAKVQSPVSRFFRLSLGAYFAFIAAHERRHLWQARQVKGAPGFP